MSIIPFIQTHEGTGALRRVPPPKGQSAGRGAYLAMDAQKSMDNTSSALAVLGGRSYAQAMLERWVSDKPMRARLRGKRRGAFLARLDPPPPEVWEFRITEPNVQFRAFARFATADLVIVTHILSRQLLGKFGSAQWKSAMFDCVARWDQLFPGQTPFQGNTVYDYITSNCHEV